MGLPTVTAAPRPADWFGQPRGLTVLFLTEMWEKFSYYGMRALLVYYMVRGLGLTPAHASLVYGGYTAAAYLTPVFGGVIADRWLGRRRAVILGGSIMAAGHFMMAAPQLFYPALAAIALGNGLFLPSLPSQIGGLYAPDDPRRDGGYTVYYAGVNLGAFLAPLVCGALGELAGWHWGFSAAGVGMALGLTVFVLGRRHLPAEPPRASEPAAALPTRSGARRALVMLGVVAAVVVFRGAYEQAGNSVALWTASRVDRSLAFGLSIPATWFQSLNPMLVFAFTPLIVMWRARRGSTRASEVASTMALGAAITAGAFGLLAAAALGTQRPDARAPWPWLAAFFALYTWGELHILPVGLALFGRLASRRLAASAIAFWFSAAFAGNLLAGGLGALWGGMTPAAFFLLLAGVALTASALLVGLSGAVARLEDPAATD
ncbi:MAG: peptide MFS transporter [Caulobacterales bacterium]|nr:peptide MFS transporter [Caulobacterales bacterium]